MDHRTKPGLDSETLRGIVLEAFNRDHETEWQTLHQSVVRIIREKDLFPSEEECEKLGLDPSYYMQGKLNPQDLRVLMSVVWSLVFEGIIMPGRPKALNSGWPFLDLTPYGEDIVSNVKPSPYDQEGYLKELKKNIPDIHDDAVFYTEEALGCFRHGLYVSAMVMIGVVCEHALHILADGMAYWLPPKEANKIERLKENFKTAELVIELRKRIEPRKPLLKSDLGDIAFNILGLGENIRKTRNKSGHPTGFKTDRKKILVYLTNLPTYLEFAYSTKEWMYKQPSGTGSIPKKNK